MTYYDRLNDVYRKFESDPPPASAQLVMLHLLHINNCNGNTGQFHCTDFRLADLTRLSKDAITQAKRILKNKGYIDFISDKKNPRKGTMYILPNAESNAEKKPCEEKAENIDAGEITEEVRHAWIAYKSEEPDLGTRYKLNEFEKLYGATTVAQAIRETKFYKGYVTLYQVQEQIKKIKGSEKNDCSRNDNIVINASEIRIRQESHEFDSIREKLLDG